MDMIIASGLNREEIEKWEIETLDIEAAFLESDMDPNMIFIYRLARRYG
jgi:hypothetical protein